MRNTIDNKGSVLLLTVLYLFFAIPMLSFTITSSRAMYVRYKLFVAADFAALGAIQYIDHDYMKGQYPNDNTEAQEISKDQNASGYVLLDILGPEGNNGAANALIELSGEGYNEIKGIGENNGTNNMNAISVPSSSRLQASPPADSLNSKVDLLEAYASVTSETNPNWVDAIIYYDKDYFTTLKVRTYYCLEPFIRVPKFFPIPDKFIISATTKASMALSN